MEHSILLHNPGAGDEDHLKSDLVLSIEKKGLHCLYFSVKKDDSWTHQLDHADLAIVAGGDGTVRRVVKELVKRTVLDKKIPLAILPMGTANNLALALGIDSTLNYKNHLKKWKKSKVQQFDIGILKNSSSIDFFLEGAGFGLFPNLIQQMDNILDSDMDKAKDELNLAFETLHNLILESPAENYWLKTDEGIYEGKCILLEIMNIPSIGPNLILAPNALLNDGLLDVVIVEEDEREEFAAYITKLRKGKSPAFSFKTIKTENLSVAYSGPYMHIDDELVLPSKEPMTIGVRNGVLDFLIY